MKIAILADPLESLKIYKDSTYAMMREAAKRGHELHVFEQHQLVYETGLITAYAARVHLTDDTQDWYRKKLPAATPLSAFDAVLMRKDPPFDMEYIYSTYLLEMAEKQGARVFNQPGAIRNNNEKLSIVEFAQFAAPTLVSRDPMRLRAFHAEQRDVIFKPLDGMGGRGIFRVRQHDPAHAGLTQHVAIEAVRHARTDERFCSVIQQPIAADAGIDHGYGRELRVGLQPGRESIRPASVRVFGRTDSIRNGIAQNDHRAGIGAGGNFDVGQEESAGLGFTRGKRDCRSDVPGARYAVWTAVPCIDAGLVGGGTYKLTARFSSAATGKGIGSLSASQKSIVVLAFLDLTEEMDQEYFGDGMTEDLIDKLSKTPGLHVPPPRSSFSFKGKQATVGEIAAALGVAYVLDGSLRESGSALRVTALLIRADDGFIVWSQSYERPLDDLPMIRDDITNHVIEALQSQ